MANNQKLRKEPLQDSCMQQFLNLQLLGLYKDFQVLKSFIRILRLHNTELGMILLRYKRKDFQQKNQSEYQNWIKTFQSLKAYHSLFLSQHNYQKKMIKPQQQQILKQDELPRKLGIVKVRLEQKIKERILIGLPKTRQEGTQFDAKIQSILAARQEAERIKKKQ